MKLLDKYFPELSTEQRERFGRLPELYAVWNERINVVSRKDLANLEERHILHSLGIAKVCNFRAGADVLDVGTGGGFPGIPLAILFPETQFHLVDSIGKKIRVVEAISESLGLQNVKAEHVRAEQLKGQYDFIVSRAVTALPRFVAWVRAKVKKENKHAIPNGILYLKGGDLTEELKEYKKRVELTELSDYYSEAFFESKKVVFLTL